MFYLLFSDSLCHFQAFWATSHFEVKPPNEKKFRFPSSFQAFSCLLSHKQRLEKCGGAPTEGALRSAESLNPLKSMRLGIPPTASSRAPVPCWGAPEDFFSPLKIFKKPNLISSPAIKFAIKIPNNGAADFTVVWGPPGPPGPRLCKDV